MEISRENKIKVILLGFANYEAGQDYGYSVYYKHLEALGVIDLSASDRWAWLEKAANQMKIIYGQQIGFPSSVIHFKEKLDELNQIDFKNRKGDIKEDLKLHTKMIIVKDFYAGKSKEDIKQILK